MCVCVRLVLVALVCIGSWCLGINMVLVCQFLVLDLVLLWLGLPVSQEFAVNF